MQRPTQQCEQCGFGMHWLDSRQIFLRKIPDSSGQEAATAVTNGVASSQEVKHTGGRDVVGGLRSDFSEL